MSASSSGNGYDVIVIGSGPGGYVCAIRAAQLGLRTACVEKRATLGGTCLNVGCIPSKALLQSSEKFEEARHHLGDYGIRVGEASLDLPALMAHKDKVVQANVAGIEYLFRKNHVDWLKGTGTITAPGRVDVHDGNGNAATYQTRHIVIATGSDIMPLPGITIDEQRIVSSTGALELTEVPPRLAVIGGGYIGLEMGSVWQRLGSQVTVIEYLDRILPGMDAELGRQMQKVLARQGLSFRLGNKVTDARLGNESITLTVEPAQGGEPETVETDIVLVAIGRRPHTQSLGLASVGVTLDDRGRVATDRHWRTNVDGIWAIGDVIQGPMLAHKAEEEGVAVAESIAGQAGHVNYAAIPGVVYTFPEVASVGQPEEALRDAGIPYKVGRFPFTANGRARAMNATDGFVKVLAHTETDRVLGVHILGAEAGTMIAEAAMAMEFSASAEDIARTCHAHPTLNEAVKEAALAVDGRPIHV